jgi:hypothetical protein
MTQQHEIKVNVIPNGMQTLRVMNAVCDLLRRPEPLADDTSVP